MNRLPTNDPLTPFEEVLGMPVEEIAAGDVFSVVLEAAIILALLAVLWRYRPLRRRFQALPPFYRYAVGAFVALFFVGQFAGTLAFPFVKWNMYGKVRPGNPTYYQYTGVRAGAAGGHAADSVDFEPARAIRVLSPARIRVKMSRQIGAAREASTPAERKKWRRQHRATLAAVGRLYNEDHPAAPLREIVTARCVAVLRDGRPPAPRCERLWSVSLDSAAAHGDAR